MIRVRFKDVEAALAAKEEEDDDDDDVVVVAMEDMTKVVAIARRI